MMSRLFIFHQAYSRFLCWIDLIFLTFNNKIQA